jgi:hypothetical protein
MFLPTLLASLALAASTTSAAPTIAGYAAVRNKCDFPVYVTSVSTTQRATQKIAPGTSYSESQSTMLGGVGTAIKITTSENGLNNNSPVLTFGYSYTPQEGIYYSLGWTQNLGYDFWGKRVRIHNTDGLPVPEIVWNGAPQPDHTTAYLDDVNLTLELCDDFAVRT